MDPSDDKEHSVPRSPPLLSLTTKGPRITSTLSFSRLFPFLSLIGLALLYTNLAIACATAFTCNKFLPTPDYLGCFRGHDRLYIVGCTFTAGMFAIVAVGMATRLKAVSGNGRRALLLGSALGVVLALPLLALSDEVNAVHFVSFEKVHILSVRVFQACACVWIITAYNSLSKLHSMLNSSEKKWFCALRMAVYSVGLLSVGVAVEKQFAYSVHTNSLLNENVESVLEWLLAGLGIVTLTLFSEFVRGFGIKFTVRVGEAEGEKSEVELTKI